MYTGSKLRPDFSVGGIGQPVVILIIFAIVWLFLGFTYALTVLAVIYGIYAFISLTYLRRTENLWFLAPFAFQSTIILFLLLAPEKGIFPIHRSSFAAIVFLAIILTVILIYIMLTKRLKWKGRNILEMAAQKVSDTTNGFTERPRPIAKIEFSMPEFNAYTLFMKSRLIFWPVVEGDRVVFVIVNMGDEYRLPLGFSSDYSENTWIAVDKQGNVSVQISRKDYMQYKEALAFDQLTESLGELFIEYFDRFKQGEGERIVYELNSVRNNPFS
jgi:hypothetical protein